MFNRILIWIRKNKLESFLLFSVLVIALFLRLYKINAYMTFLGDEGRDVRIVRDLLKGNLVFIGPQTSVGNMYLGPLYYYMMAPALFLSNLDPVGPAIMVALLGVLTIALTWGITRIWFNKTAALITAVLFTLSPVAIIYSRSSWNPNPMPFFALISIYAISLVWLQKKWRYLPLLGFSFASALQMHYLGLLLLPTLAFFWFVSARRDIHDSKLKKIVIKQSTIATIVFFLLMSPLILFDIKHGGPNYRAFVALLFNKQSPIDLSLFNRFLPLLGVFSQDLILSRVAIHSLLFGVAFIIISFWILFRAKKSTRKHLNLLLFWLLSGLLGLGLYRQVIYAHYLGFLFPVVYILLGVVLANLIKKNFLSQVLSISVFIYLVSLSLQNSPLRQPPNNQLSRTKQITNLIIKQSNNQPFNLGLIATQNYDEPYRYLLENANAPLVKAEDKVLDQLFVICENGDSCSPLGNSKWQIAIFGIAQIDQQWQIDSIKIYKLTHP